MQGHHRSRLHRRGHVRVQIQGDPTLGVARHFAHDLRVRPLAQQQVAVVCRRSWNRDASRRWQRRVREHDGAGAAGLHRPDDPIPRAGLERVGDADALAVQVDVAPAQPKQDPLRDLGHLSTMRDRAFDAADRRSQAALRAKSGPRERRRPSAACRSGKARRTHGHDRASPRLQTAAPGRTCAVSLRPDTCPSLPTTATLTLPTCSPGGREPARGNPLAWRSEAGRKTRPNWSTKMGRPKARPVARLQFLAAAPRRADYTSKTARGIGPRGSFGLRPAARDPHDAAGFRSLDDVPSGHG